MDGWDWIREDDTKDVGNCGDNYGREVCFGLFLFSFTKMSLVEFRIYRVFRYPSRVNTVKILGGRMYKLSGAARN
jgi:hypothetical protein